MDRAPLLETATPGACRHPRLRFGSARCAWRWSL